MPGLDPIWVTGNSGLDGDHATVNLGRQRTRQIPPSVAMEETLPMVRPTTVTEG